MSTQQGVFRAFLSAMISMSDFRTGRDKFKTDSIKTTRWHKPEDNTNYLVHQRSKREYRKHRKVEKRRLAQQRKLGIANAHKVRCERMKTARRLKLKIISA
jgi:hypothetical protein